MHVINAPPILTAQTNPLFGVEIQKNTMKRKEGNCTEKNTSVVTNGEKVYRETKNIEDLAKRKRWGDTSSTTILDRTRSGIGNGNGEMGG